MQSPGRDGPCRCPVAERPSLTIPCLVLSCLVLHSIKIASPAPILLVGLHPGTNISEMQSKNHWNGILTSVGLWPTFRRRKEFGKTMRCLAPPSRPSSAPHPYRYPHPHPSTHKSIFSRRRQFINENARCTARLAWSPWPRPRSPIPSSRKEILGENRGKAITHVPG